jgi:hypothetical protein
LSKPPNKWREFLVKTQAWIKPESLGGLAMLAVGVANKPELAGKLTPYELFQNMCLSIGKDGIESLARTTIRRFIKLVEEGGGFQFLPNGRGGSMWGTKFGNTLDDKIIIEAYIRAVASRIKSQFHISAEEIPELCSLLLPVEMADEVLILKHTLGEKSTDQDLT